MSGVPALAVSVPLEHGKVRNPEKAEVSRGIAGLLKRSMLRRVPLSEIESELSAGLEELQRSLLRLCLAHYQHPQVSRLDSSGFENSFARIRIISGKTIWISHQTYRGHSLRMRERSVGSNGSPFGPGDLSSLWNSNEQRSKILADLECRC